MENAIGQHVAGLIPNGATLQTGIGQIPSAVLAALVNHHDLGIHTEMLSDGVIDLVARGVINGKKKTLLKGKIVTSFVMGTRKLYDWVHDNPVIELRASDFTNDPLIIARNEKMIAINSAAGRGRDGTSGGRYHRRPILVRDRRAGRLRARRRSKCRRQAGDCVALDHPRRSGEPHPNHVRSRRGGRDQPR